MEPPETLADILPSVFFELDSLHCLPVGVEPAEESLTVASEPMGEESVPEEPAASPMDFYDNVVEEVYFEDRGKRTKVKILKVEDYLEKAVLVNLYQMEDCSHPLRDVSEDQVPRPLLSFQRNGLDTETGRICFRLNPLKNKADGPQTEIFNKGKTLPVLKKTLTVDFVLGCHRLTVLRQMETSADAASVRVKSCVSLPIFEVFISRRDGKSLSYRGLLQMSGVANAMSDIVMKDDSFVAVLKSVFRYADTFPSE